MIFFLFVDIHEKVEKIEENNQDIYVPLFEIPPITSPFSPKWPMTDDQQSYNYVSEEKMNNPQTYKVNSVMKSDDQDPSSKSHKRPLVDDHYPYNSDKGDEGIGVTTSRSTNDSHQFGNVKKDGNEFIFLEDWVENEYPETLNVSKYIHI